MRPINVMALLLLAAATAFPAVAQQSQEFGDYEVHYNTLNTNMLSPEIASVYGIQRAGTQAMLNVTVLQKENREPTEARITATATNLTGQRREIELRQINDQGAITNDISDVVWQFNDSSVLMSLLVVVGRGEGAKSRG